MGLGGMLDSSMMHGTNMARTATIFNPYSTVGALSER